MRQTLILLTLALLALVLVIGFGVYHLGEYQSRRFKDHMREVADEVADSILTDWGVEYPCPPDTVYKYQVKVIEYQMPPGRWVKLEFVPTTGGILYQSNESRFAFWLSDSLSHPDSVFILSPGKE